MKSKKQKAAEYAAWKAKRERIENLASAALDRYSIDEILDALCEACNDMTEFDKWCREHVKFKEGAIVIYPQSIADESRINDFLDSNYPTLGDKQIALFDF